MDEYPSNSHKSREEPASEDKQVPRVEKVVTGQVVRRKKSIGRRFSDTFGGGDARGVASYVVIDVLIPAAKETISEAVTQGVERMIFGEARSASRRSRGGSFGTRGSAYTNYRTPPPSSRDRYERDDPREKRRSRASYDIDEVVLATRVEADEVLERLFELIERFEAATVADLYELTGDRGSYIDRKWGWTNLHESSVKYVNPGYLLILPRPEPLD